MVIAALGMITSRPEMQKNSHHPVTQQLCCAQHGRCWLFPTTVGIKSKKTCEIAPPLGGQNRLIPM